jgi:ATP synthase protein I
VITAAVALVLVAVSAVVGGSRGLVGALCGVLLVTAFFGISVVAVGRAARAGVFAMMLTAIVTYTAKILILAVLVAWLARVDVFDARLFAFTAIGCVLAWSAAQVTTSIRARVFYFDPDGER